MMVEIWIVQRVALNAERISARVVAVSRQRLSLGVSQDLRQLAPRHARKEQN
jgi:hypothetical protein